ncbi:MAG: hypothetical protein HRU70_09320 [Phycisphaeraceae bacterium]|nr:MAG: hypothetical protein HRU70_09320 [Phycisphaeraceae bacterium]
MSIRETINKSPWMGWAVAGVLLALSVGLVLFRSGGGGGELTDTVTILFTDTNEEIKMKRGRLEMQLLEVPGELDPAKGIVNPATGEATGVIIDKNDWRTTIEKLNAMKRAAREASASRAGQSKSAPADR